MNGQITVNKCVICLAVFGSWPEFNMHHRQTHGVFDRPIVPEKTTNRTKQQIVSDFELRHPNLFNLEVKEDEKEWVG